MVGAGKYVLVYACAKIRGVVPRVILRRDFDSRAIAILLAVATHGQPTVKLVVKLRIQLCCSSIRV